MHGGARGGRRFALSETVLIIIARKVRGEHVGISSELKVLKVTHLRLYARFVPDTLAGAGQSDTRGTRRSLVWPIQRLIHNLDI